MRECENTGTVYNITVQERDHKSNEALPARITIPNPRSDFLEQRRTLSTGHRVDGTMVPEQSKPIMIGCGSTRYRTSSTMINPDSLWCQCRMSYPILVLGHGRGHEFRRSYSRTRTLRIACNTMYIIIFTKVVSTKLWARYFMCC